MLAGMAEVRDRGLVAARHLEDDIWEVRVDGDRVIYRILFAERSARAGPALTRGVQAEDPEDAARDDRTREPATQRLAPSWRRPATAQGRRPLS